MKFKPTVFTVTDLIRSWGVLSIDNMGGLMGGHRKVWLNIPPTSYFMTQIFGHYGDMRK